MGDSEVCFPFTCSGTAPGNALSLFSLDPNRSAVTFNLVWVGRQLLLIVSPLKILSSYIVFFMISLSFNIF